MDTIVADNTIVNGASANCSNPITSGSDNLEDDAAKTCGFDLPVGGPDLAALADNGGPTQTQAPEPGKPAIAVTPAAACIGANDAPLTTDQRGFPRPGNNKTTCDVGAFESQGPDTPEILAPADGATYMPGEIVHASYSCAAGAPGSPLQARRGLRRPRGERRVDRHRQPGSHWLLGVGDQRRRRSSDASVSYTVAAVPGATIAVPASGAVYGIGQSVSTSFSCAEGAGGPGIASCLDKSGGGSSAQLDTLTPGQHTYAVTATSLDGFTQDASSVIRWLLFRGRRSWFRRAVGCMGLGSRCWRVFLCGGGLVVRGSRVVWISRGEGRALSWIP